MTPVCARTDEGERENPSSCVMRHGRPDPARVALERALTDIRAAKAPLEAAEAELLSALGLPATPAGMITLKQAAMDWGVSEDTVRRWAVEGRIRAEKMIGRWYVQAERPA